MTEEKKVASEEMRVKAKALEELQLTLEPIRDKALDEKARLTGYAQCAEQMIAVIVAKMADLRKKADAAEKEAVEEAAAAPEEVRKVVSEEAEGSKPARKKRVKPESA